MRVMLGVADASVSGATWSFSGNFQYGAIVYGKGALFYGELRKLIGDEVFFRSLRDYFAKFSGKLANENSLKNIVIANAPARKEAIEKLYARWINELHGDEDLGTATVWWRNIQRRQQRFVGSFGRARRELKRALKFKLHERILSYVSLRSK